MFDGSERGASCGEHTIALEGDYIFQSLGDPRSLVTMAECRTFDFSASCDYDGIIASSLNNRE